jgi:TetR/AcrR family transcriptional regulator, transcriptional repressor of bet genes
MPKRVDHGVRRRQITDAVCRITVKGGLSAATFREVAAEAGVSVRLVQYYFGTKDELLLVTQRHVAERATARFKQMIEAADDTTRDSLSAVLRSFIPVDEESREIMLMFVALHTASLLDPTLARRETRAVPDALHRVVRTKLLNGGLREGADADLEATVLVSIVPSLAQSVLDNTLTPEQAFRALDYAINRALV